MKAAINPPNTPLIDNRGFITPEWYRYLVRAKQISDGITDAAVLTVADAVAVFPNSRRFAVTAGELDADDDGSSLTVGLADFGTAGTYGSASQTLSLTIDAKGRVVEVTPFALNTDNVTEGAINLYFTVQRARNAVSGGTGIVYTPASGVIALADTAVTPGTYGSATQVPVLTVDQQGRITLASAATIGTGVTSFNTRSGAVTLLASDITAALTSPLPVANGGTGVTTSTGTGSVVRANSPTLVTGITITKGIAGSAGAALLVQPSDYGVGKPRVFIDNPTATSWRFGIFDTAVAMGLTLDLTGATVPGTFACNMPASAAAANVVSTANGTALARASSSLRFKTDILDLSVGEGDAIFGLRPVTYRSTTGVDNPDWRWLGLIAEEVAPIEPRLVSWGYWPEDYETDENGNTGLKPDAQLSPVGVQYDRLAILLLGVIQRQEARIAALEDQEVTLRNSSDAAIDEEGA